GPVLPGGAAGRGELDTAGGAGPAAGGGVARLGLAAAGRPARPLDRATGGRLARRLPVRLSAAGWIAWRLNHARNAQPRAAAERGDRRVPGGGRGRTLAGPR